MIPFLKHREASVAGLLVKTRAPDNKEDAESEEDPAAAIDACSQELIKAVHAKDVSAVSNALKDAFDILEATPHEESPEEHSYDAQNQLAAKQG